MVGRNSCGLIVPLNPDTKSADVKLAVERQWAMTILHHKFEIEEGDDRSPSESSTPDGNQIFSWVEGPMYAPCYACKKTELRTNGSLSVLDYEGNVLSTEGFDICSDCAAERDRRIAEEDAEWERQKVIQEQKVRDLLSRVPKQMGFDMGLD